MGKHKLQGEKHSVKRSLFMVLGLLGPGLVAALADNDAGGVISYAVTGAKFGVGLFIPLTLLMVLITYTVQEMAMRLGVVAEDSYNTLVKQKYGKFWMIYQLLSLVVENFITLMTEFIGMSAGLVILGLPMWAAVLIGLVLVLAIALFRGYATKEKIAVGVGCLNIVFIVIACMTQPDWNALANSFITWAVPSGDQGNVIWYMIALVGNAIAPWMIFYQNSAYINKGSKKEDLRKGKMDTVIGCVLQVVIAVFIILIGAALFGCIPDIENAGPSELIGALQEKFGFVPAMLFGIGLFDAGLLAAITVSLSSSWSVAEAFGWSKSLDDSITKAPKFYGVYFGCVIAAAVVVMIPGLPLNHLAILVQVISGILMTPILVFLTLLTSRKDVMGEYQNTMFQKIKAWIVVAVLGGVSILSFVTLF